MTEAGEEKKTRKTSTGSFGFGADLSGKRDSGRRAQGPGPQVPSGDKRGLARPARKNAERKQVLKSAVGKQDGESGLRPLCCPDESEIRSNASDGSCSG